MRAYKGFDYKNLRPRLTRISTRPNFERVWSTMDFTCSTFETSIANPRPVTQDVVLSGPQAAPNPAAETQ
jgi:hypothetical protein